MIRRDQRDSAGQPRWLLIDQIAHAMLAGQLAESWRFEPPLPPFVHDQLIAAVFRHDDGWQDWDSHPGAEFSRRPLNFTEMATPVSTQIWRQSVAAGATIGPLATYAIAGHFRALLLRFDSWRQTDADALQAGQGFIAFAQAEMQAALEAWQASAASPSPQWAALSLQALQAFDALSLWFCCAPRTAAETFAVPNSPATRFAPTSDWHVVEVSPWPFSTAELSLELHGRSISAALANPEKAAQSAVRQDERLWWRLLPGAG